MPELRKDPITGSWVIFAPERANRPMSVPRHSPVFTDPATCPFCPGREDQTPAEVMRFPASVEYPGQPWSLRVIEDKFPLFTPGRSYHRYGEGMYDLMAGFGFHELVVESPLHSETYREFREAHIRDILHVYQHRSTELSRNDKIRQILITRNSGTDSGDHVSHPHSHVVALPIVPKRIQEEAHGCLRYYQFKERCIYCDIIQQETEERTRLVAENEAFAAFCAYAGRFPFEVNVVPRTHSSRFETIRPNEIALLAELLKAVLSTMQHCLEDPPMEFIFHTAPTQQAWRDELSGMEKFYHWHIEIIPKLTRTAGFEWGSGFYINPVLPEESAKLLRRYLQKAP